MAIKNPADVRTIVSATSPMRFRDRTDAIILKVWFEELDEPLPVLASPYDNERHCKELWIRAMAGQYGPISVIPIDLAGFSPSIMIDLAGKPNLVISGEDDGGVVRHVALDLATICEPARLSRG